MAEIRELKIGDPVTYFQFKTHIMSPLNKVQAVVHKLNKSKITIKLENGETKLVLPENVDKIKMEARC